MELAGMSKQPAAYTDSVAGRREKLREKGEGT
jgi:hypothetical protein